MPHRDGDATRTEVTRGGVTKTGGRSQVSGDCGHQGDTSPADEWLSVAQLACELGVTAETITDWIAQGKVMPHFQFGPRPQDVRFRRREIASLLQTRGRTPPTGKVYGPLRCVTQRFNNTLATP